MIQRNVRAANRGRHLVSAELAMMMGDGISRWLGGQSWQTLGQEAEWDNEIAERAGSDVHSSG